MNKEQKNKVILSIDNLKKYFVNQGIINKAVDGVSFDLHEGEIVGLIGESGSGKTTVGRTILRLYDDYNGFVRLKDKIISGKRINSSLNHFLRKNVQMIFQDPHASLNPQQNVYSILKEPLLVNGIMRAKVKDLFKDWLKVKQTFKYTFHIQAMQLELNNLREINYLAAPLFEKWVHNFETFEFDYNTSKEDNFASFYGYLEEKQQIESLIINNLYSNASRLIEFYYEIQKKYRDQDMEPVELAIKAHEKQIAKAKILSKMSYAQYEAHKELKKLKAQKNEVVSEFKNLKRETVNTFINYISESKSEKGLSNIARLMSTNLEYYVYTYKNEILYKQKINTLKFITKKCKYLGFDEAKNLIKLLDEYIKDFFNKNLKDIHYIKDFKKNVKNIVAQNFKFQFEEFVVLSDKNQAKWIKDIAVLEQKIKDILQIVKRNDQPEISKEKLEEEFAQLAKAKEKYQVGRSKFLISYKDKILKLYNEIQKEKATYEKLVSLQNYCNKKYSEIKNNFYLYIKELTDNKVKSHQERLETLEQELKNKSLNVEKVKSLSKQVHKIKDKIKHEHAELELTKKMYRSDISLKEDTLKSFNIEKKFLLKDIKRIYLLLGIDHKWVEQNLKATEEDTSPSKHIKWQKRFNIFDYKLSYPIAKLLISELLYKTSIYKSLEDVGLLKQFAYRYPHEFSGGQLQRIVIARALITEPKIIVADEPIASLDISIQAQVVNLLKELCIRKNIGLIFIAHDLSMIEYVADNVQIMHLGKIVESGKTELIYANPIHPYTINLFKAIPKISNANEKFQNVSFELDYLDAQQFPNEPINIEVAPNHFVYGTEEQVKTWVASNKNIKTK